jgi:hypothetical protein
LIPDTTRSGLSFSSAPSATLTLVAGVPVTDVASMPPASVTVST